MSHTYRATDFIDELDLESLEFTDWDELLEWLNRSDLRALYASSKPT